MANWPCSQTKINRSYNGVLVEGQSMARVKSVLWLGSGPAFGLLDRLHPIGTRATGCPALRLQTYANLHFQSKLLVYCRPGAHSIFKRGAHCQHKKWNARYWTPSIILSLIETMVSLFFGDVWPRFFNSSYVLKLFSVSVASISY